MFKNIPFLHFQDCCMLYFFPKHILTLHCQEYSPALLSRILPCLTAVIFPCGAVRIFPCFVAKITTLFHCKGFSHGSLWKKSHASFSEYLLFSNISYFTVSLKRRKKFLSGPFVFSLIKYFSVHCHTVHNFNSFIVKNRHSAVGLLVEFAADSVLCIILPISLSKIFRKKPQQMSLHNFQYNLNCTVQENRERINCVFCELSSAASYEPGWLIMAMKA